jgi:hypothetical protein
MMIKNQGVSRRQLNRDISLISFIFGGLLMFGAIYRLNGLLDYGYYRFMFQHLSAEWTAIRYCGSLSLRLVAILTAFGLFRQVEFYRRLAIGLGFFTLLTLPWKHPYEVFFHIAVYTESMFPRVYPVLSGDETLAYPAFPLISMLAFNTLDLIFNAALIWMLTRPGVRAKFR